MVRRKPPLLFALLLVLLSGCSVTEEDSTQAEFERTKDRLRSIPYVSYSETPTAGKSGITVLDQKLSCPGYNLYVIRGLCLAELVDSEGNILRTWHDDGFRFWQDFELLADGTFIVLGENKAEANTAFEHRLENRAILKFTWNGKKLGESKLPAHHELHFSAGNPMLTLLHGFRLIPEVDATDRILDNQVAVLSAHGEVLDSISLYDLLKDVPDFQLQEVKATNVYQATFIDLFHANTAEWIVNKVGLEAIPSQCIMVTMRHQDTVAIIDWKTKQVIWTWGQGVLSGPHDATVLENGNVLVFDNGLGRQWSRIIELDPQTREIVWQYQSPDRKDFYTATRGTSQRLPNGNTLITESNKGRAFEVMPSGQVVWDFNTPHMDSKNHRANIIRMRRYPLAYIQSILDQDTNKNAAQP